MSGRDTGGGGGQRLDIQGLRALAVALVVVFHLSPQVLSGGYIGVDVFFVISGYLITGHLLREVERTGAVRLSEFWARRVRRLLPAALLVLAVSFGAVLLFLPVTSHLQNFTEIAFAAGYILNWRLAYDSVDYLAAHNDSSLVQHYWSLSVEEQFYIVWPILIVAAVWIAAKTGIGSRRRAIAAALILVFVASLAWSVIETTRSQPSAYFVTTTRAWEFAAGGLLALAPAFRLSPAPRAALSWGALAAIVASALAFGPGTAFPGWIALIPVLGTCALIWAGGATAETAAPAAAWAPQRLAGFAPVQVLGDISYSVYLWHWPLVVVATALLGERPDWRWAILLAALTVALALLTKRYVEDPVRRVRGRMRDRAPTYAMMAVGIAAVLAVTVTPIRSANADAEQYEAAMHSEAEDPDSCFGAHAVLNDECERPYEVDDVDAETVDPLATQLGAYLREHDPEHCETGTVAQRTQVECAFPGDGARVALVGDSHAEHLIAPVSTVARERGWDLSVHARGGCSGLENDDLGTSEPQRGCIAWRDRVIDGLIADDTVDTVVFSTRAAVENASEEADETLRALMESGKRVVVVLTVPGTENMNDPDKPALAAPECVALAQQGGDDRAPCSFPEPERDDWVTAAALEAGADVIDPHEVFCEDGTCHVIVGGAIAYTDTNHLSPPFAESLAPWLEEKLVPLVER